LNSQNKSQSSAVANQTVIIDSERCIGCGACVRICPRQILYIDEQTGVCDVTDQTKCDRLRGCEFICPTQAIKVR
jgi:NAD-dependent dihydropyrimidine dehydrogenase PreA subunit